MTITRWVLQTRLMHILPYTIANTNDLLTGCGGLVCVAELMRQIGFSSWVERYFPRLYSRIVRKDDPQTAPVRPSITPIAIVLDIEDRPAVLDLVGRVAGPGLPG